MNPSVVKFSANRCITSSMHRLFCLESDIQQNTLQLSQDDSHYLKNVVRLSPKDSLELVTETRLLTVTDLLLSKKHLEFIIKNEAKLPKEEPFHITLAQCLPKQDKFSDILRCCTELGVSAFIPVSSDRSIPKIEKQQEKIQRWTSVLNSAASQSKQFKCPKMLPFATLKELDTAPYDCILIFWEVEKKPLKHVLNTIQSHSVKRILVVIGPEGGLSTEEVDYLVKKGGLSVSLGKTILRVEHAGLAAISQIKYALENND